MNNKQQGSSASLPVRDTIVKSPLQISYYGFSDDEEFRIAFLAENMNESPISADDYQYQWPRFIEDEHENLYEVTDVELRQGTLFERALSNYEIGMIMTLSPPPGNENGNFFSIPFYMVPNIYEEGYRFPINTSTIDHHQLGDMAISNLELDGRLLTFDLIDDHPDADGSEEYLFTAIQENQEIFPMFINMRRSNPYTHIEVEFARELILPTRLSITRTTSPLPEWRFSMIIDTDQGRMVNESEQKEGEEQ
ncbi:protein kinase family protein [Salisediminibacterium beveridgei]|uniref:hypothetical protein n=1 Tax=Salisediminibacterium beveridgei TaxID=632773 RepID=UPI0012EDE8AD|nr:hypothetical protein [Salisediminibacterium beveridgei]